MRKQIAAANWKMNLTYQQGEKLLNDILAKIKDLGPDQQVLFSVPFPYLHMAIEKIKNKAAVFIAAQNCYHKAAGAYTGEVSVEMLASMNLTHCLVGHSERREYFAESNEVLAEKINACLAQNIIPVFCCGEALPVREANTQNDFVTQQLQESLFHLSEDEVKKTVIAYEPIWAIGTGKTASTQQAQEMHQHLRSVLAGKYGNNIAAEIPILYGGSVKAANAVELFTNADVDGGLVGGASLVADEFVQIIQSLK